jgi:hypothetical protein
MVVTEPRLKMAVRDAAKSRSPAGYRIKPFDRERHARDVLAIYEADNRRRSASAVRPGGLPGWGNKPAKPETGKMPAWAAWRPFPIGSNWGIRTSAFVVTDGRGRLAGYAAHDRPGKEMNVTEAGCRTPEAFPALTAEIARRAAAMKTDAITFFIPPDHPYAAYLRRYTIANTVHYYENSQGMGRIIRLKETLSMCARDFAERLESSRFHAQRLALSFVTDLGSATLISSRGKIDVTSGSKSSLKVKMPQGVLTQLLVGYRDPDDAASAPGVSVPLRARELMRTLFPPGYPYMCSGDRF